MRQTGKGAAWGSVAFGVASSRDPAAGDLRHALQRTATTSCTPGSRSRSRPCSGWLALLLARRRRRRHVRLARDGGRRRRCDGRPRPRGHRALPGGFGARRARRVRAARVRRVTRLSSAAETRLQSRGDVRHRLQPPRGQTPPGPRLPRARGADEDPSEVPPGTRGRAVRHAPCTDVRQGLPAVVRGGARTRRAAVRRRVQLALHGGRGRRAAASAPCSPAATRPRAT